MHAQATRNAVVTTQEEALAEMEKYGYPVTIRSSFVVGGWKRVAENETKFSDFITRGLSLSPVSEVTLTWENQFSPAAFEIFKKLEPFYPPNPWGRPQWLEGGRVYANGWLDLRDGADREKLMENTRQVIATFVEVAADIHLKEGKSLESFDNERYSKAVVHELERLFILKDLDFQIETGDLAD